MENNIREGYTLARASTVRYENFTDNSQVINKRGGYYASREDAAAADSSGASQVQDICSRSPEKDAASAEPLRRGASRW